MLAQTLFISLLFFSGYSSFADQTNLSNESSINQNGDQAAQSANTIKESILDGLFADKNFRLNVEYQQYFSLSPHCSTYVIPDKNNPGSFTIRTHINHHTQVFEDPSDLNAYRTLHELCKSTGNNDVAIEFDSEAKEEAHDMSVMLAHDRDTFDANDVAIKFDNNIKENVHDENIINTENTSDANITITPTKITMQLMQLYNSGQLKTFNDYVQHIAHELEKVDASPLSSLGISAEQLINDAVPLITCSEDYTDTEYAKKIMQTFLQFPLYQLCDIATQVNSKLTFDAKKIKILVGFLTFYLQMQENKQNQIANTMPSETLAYMTHTAPNNIALLVTFFGQKGPATQQPYTINLDEMAKPCQIDQILVKPAELLKLPFVKKLYRSTLMAKIGTTEEEYLQQRTKETDYKILNAYKQAESFELPGIQSKIRDCQDKYPIRSITVEFTITKEELKEYKNNTHYN